LATTRREFFLRTAAAGALVSLPLSWSPRRARVVNVPSELTVAAIGVADRNFNPAVA